MNLLEKYLHKISYKFPKGYPDLTQESDRLILENELNKLTNEAYSTFPKSEKEIDNPKIKKLFSIIKSYPKLDIEDPIVLDPSISNVVKISRSLQRDTNFIKYLSDKLNIELDNIEGGKWEGINIKWGEGSRGGRGIKSKGLGFENELIADLETLRNEDINKSNWSNFKYPNLIIDIAEELNLEQDNFEVLDEGGKNQSRPLGFESGGPIIKFSQETAAKTLTDITIKTNSTEYYLSAKYGNTLTFFNSGVTKFLSAEEIKSGIITNIDGKNLLDTLGIDNKTFCKVFNEYPNTNFSKLNGPTSKYNASKLKDLIKSGIGEGYYMVKAGGKSGHEFTEIDSSYADSASNIAGGVEVYYGGLGGDGKRIDVIFESDLYKFKINIRNKQGGLYPSHIMCDYVKK